MKTSLKLSLQSILLLCMSIFFCSTIYAETQGIYIHSGTANNTKLINQFINQSKSVGINTFVVDAKNMGETYAQNIKRIKNAGIQYVARVVVFPLGGTPSQVKSKAYWEKIYTSVDKAIKLGADEIQLDYIRYNTKQSPSNQNAQDVLKVIKFFKSRVSQHQVPLQVAVFGVTSFGPSKRIGQDIKLYDGVIDTLCPMLYPSHYEPFRQHAKTPYKTVYSSLEGIKAQYNQKVPFKVNTYIELSNYRYKLSPSQKIDYINAQIKATKDADVGGWYAWSANNHYSVLFEVLREKQPQKVKLGQ